MTQLLISVKNVEEARLALACGADVIDLKDPSVGALGALDLPTSFAIIAAVNNHVTNQISQQTSIQVSTRAIRRVLSTTVGENHADLNALIPAIEQRAAMGQIIIKIAVSALFYGANFLIEMRKLTDAGVKIVAVFFTAQC